MTSTNRSMMCQACGALSAQWRSDGTREREERLFTNRSNRPTDDMTAVLRTDNDTCLARRACELWRLRQSAPHLAFFFAHAVRARGSDGHQNVLSLIGYSHMLERIGESKKLGVFN